MTTEQKNKYVDLLNDYTDKLSCARADVKMYTKFIEVVSNILCGKITDTKVKAVYTPRGEIKQKLIEYLKNHDPCSGTYLSKELGYPQASIVVIMKRNPDLFIRNESKNWSLKNVTHELH